MNVFRPGGLSQQIHEQHAGFRHGHAVDSMSVGANIRVKPRQTTADAAGLANQSAEIVFAVPPP